MPIKEPNAKISEELKKIFEAEEKTTRLISETIYSNLDKVLEQIIEEKLLSELKKRLKTRKIKVEFDDEFLKHSGIKQFRYLTTENYKLDLRET